MSEGICHLQRTCCYERPDMFPRTSCDTNISLWIHYLQTLGSNVPVRLVKQLKFHTELTPIFLHILCTLNVQ
jgi:hypothetical protein